jgi:hypothetical protein
MLFLESMVLVSTLIMSALEIIKLHKELKTADSRKSTVSGAQEVILVIIIILKD